MSKAARATLVPIIVVTLASCGNTTQDEPQAGAASTAPVPPATSSATESTPSYEIAGSVQGYETLTELLDQSSVTVMGRVTERLGTDSVADAPDVSWSMWELEVTDPLGAEVPQTLVVVDLDRSRIEADEANIPAIREDLTGLFALNSGDKDGDLIHPGFGKTYYAITVLEESTEGYSDVLGFLDTVPSIDPVEEQIQRDNES